MLARGRDPEVGRAEKKLRGRMKELLAWSTTQPGAFASLIGAVIAASVGLFTFSLTQLLTSRRERAVFLTPKLEALYLLLNEVAAHHARVCQIFFRALKGDEEARVELRDMDVVKLYGHDNAKKIVMYIRLYFPKLSEVHQLLFGAQREIDNMLPPPEGDPV